MGGHFEIGKKKVNSTIIKEKIPLFILLGIYSCKATEQFANASDQEPGKWYFAVLEQNSTNAVDAESGFVLAVVPPKFGKRKVILTDELLSEYATKDGKYRFEVVERHLKFVIREVSAPVNRGLHFETRGSSSPSRSKGAAPPVLITSPRFTGAE